MDSVYVRFPGTGEGQCHGAANVQKLGIAAGSQRYESHSVGLRFGRLGPAGASFWGKEGWTVSTAL